MNKQTFAALAAFLLIAPACVLVGSGLLALAPPPALTHPGLVLGGLAIAVIWSVAVVMRLRLGRTRETVMITVLIDTHGRGMNLAALTMGCLLLVVIAAYLFMENFDAVASL